MTFEYERLIVYRKAKEYNRLAAPLIARVKLRNLNLGRHLERNGDSLTSNIPEAAADDRPRVKANYYRIAKREAEEAAANWEKAQGDGYVTMEEIEPLHAALDEVARMLAALIRRFDRRPKRGN